MKGMIWGLEKDKICINVDLGHIIDDHRNPDEERGLFVRFLAEAPRVITQQNDNLDADILGIHGGSLWDQDPPQ